MTKPLLIANLSRSDQIAQYTRGYGRIAQDLLDQGWSPFLLVLKFRHLGGRRTTMLAQIQAAAERAYAQVLTRVWRHPRVASVRDLRPVWILVPDVPVPKSEKVHLRELIPNDGVHLQGVAMMPPGGRLRVPLDVHLAQAGNRYCPPDSPLTSIHATPITSDLPYVNRYNFKGVFRGRASADDVLLLPRSSAELDSRPHPAAEPWRPLVRAAS